MTVRIVNRPNTRFQPQRVTVRPSRPISQHDIYTIYLDGEITTGVGFNRRPINDDERRRLFEELEAYVKLKEVVEEFLAKRASFADLREAVRAI